MGPFVALMSEAAPRFLGFALIYFGAFGLLALWLRARQQMAHWAYAIVVWSLPPLVTGFCCAAPVVLPIAFNNFLLYQLEQQLYQYPLPPNTYILHRASSLSPNTGNGDYCRFQVQQTLATTLSQADITAFYADAEVPGISPSGYPVRLWVDFAVTASQPTSLQFTLEANDMTDRAFDIRC